MATCNNSTSPIQSDPTRVSLLDVFFPSLTAIIAAAQELLAGDPNKVTSVLCGFGILLYLVQRVSSYVYNWTENYLSSKVHISYWTQTHDMIAPWIASRSFAHNARSFVCRISRTEQKSLSFLPWDGTFPFFYRGHLCWFRSKSKTVGSHVEEEISIGCLSRSPAILHELLHECRKAYLKSMENKTPIYEHEDGKWKQVTARDTRPISTIIMNEEKKAELLKDIGAFLSPDSREWYKERGFPYRRGYLFYGPPGTGKSSLSFSLSGHHGLPIYVFKLASAEPKTLSSSLADLPPNCVLLMEDVDTAGITHDRQAKTGTTGGPEVSPVQATSKISLSDLLNAIDGVASQEGRLLIMTTNHIERLDGALIRAGRVDKKLELSYADKDISTRLFLLVFRQPRGDISNQDEIERLASDFARKVPEGEFSPAEIECFLLENKDSSHTALKKVESWVRRIREERKKTRADLGVANNDCR